MSEGFAKALEAMAHLPIKGHVPSDKDIASVVKTSQEAFVSTPRDAKGRQLPTQAEIAAIVASVSRPSSSAEPRQAAAEAEPAAGAR
jgi:hypothetical protein